MILLFTDFGVGSPYVGQMKAVLHQEDAHPPIIDLHADLSCFRPEPASYLLAAYLEEFPPGSVFLCVVDPGVGTRQRWPVVINCRDRWLVGPDNGLFNALPAQFSKIHAWEIVWQPQRLSSTFHGRDLFAPIAARLSRGDLGGLRPWPDWAADRADWPADRAEVIYVDHYGNLFTGLRASSLGRPRPDLGLGEGALPWAETYGEVAPGEPLVYVNNLGLVEIGVNQGNAAELLRAGVGTPISLRV